jgi:hypothetical protein
MGPSAPLGGVSGISASRPIPFRAPCTRTKSLIRHQIVTGECARIYSARSTGLLHSLHAVHQFTTADGDGRGWGVQRNGSFFE